MTELEKRNLKLYIGSRIADRDKWRQREINELWIEIDRLTDIIKAQGETIKQLEKICNTRAQK